MKLERMPAAGPVPGIWSIRARKPVASPNRRMDRRTVPLACWNDRSKYGATPGVLAMTSIRPGRTSAGCR